MSVELFIERQRLLGRCVALCAGVLAVVGVLAGASLAAAQPAGGASAPVDGGSGVIAVASVGMTVGDLDRSVAFYTGVLGFHEDSRVESAGEALEHLTGVFGARVVTARLHLGTEHVELTQYLAPEGLPLPVDSRSNDRWFQHIAIVVSDIDKAYAHLRAHRVRHASSGPQTLPGWNPNAGGISAFYFKDPDGHTLEVIHFPKGKGDPRWQESTDALFLGIDHTAIVVADTDRSIVFYRDVLGMRVAGGAENYGTEQEHLNNVFGARLRITAMRAASGPGVELLEYLAPTDGREYPRMARENDRLHWNTTLSAIDLAALGARVRAAHASWVSPGVVGGVEAATGFASARDVRDPDGHVLRLGQAVGTPENPTQAAASATNER